MKRNARRVAPRLKVFQTGSVGERVNLVGRDDPGLSGQFGAEGAQLTVHNLQVIFRKPPRHLGHVHKVNQDPRALDVPQELHPQPLTLVRPLDQPWEVGHHEGPELAEIDHPQIRLEGGERIRRDLRPRRRDSRDQGRFPRVRKAHEPDVGDEL